VLHVLSALVAYILYPRRNDKIGIVGDCERLIESGRSSRGERPLFLWTVYESAQVRETT
jgi:hypothetical protein